MFVTFFGIGKIKYASGTFASLITAIILFYCFHILNLSNQLIFYTWLAIFIYSFYAVSKHIKNNDDKDPKEIVIDEVIGQSIPLYMYETAHGSIKDLQEAILFYLYIFILFRFFDIKKPFPVNYFDKKFKNSFGVIFDDVVAGFYVVFTLILFMVVKTKLFT